MRLDVGCGEYPRGDINVDRYRFVQAKDRTHVPTKADVVADAHYLPFREGAFEEVFSGHTIEHLDHPDRFLGECERVSSNRVTIVAPSRWQPGHSLNPFEKWTLKRRWFEARGYTTRLVGTPLLSLRSLPGPLKVLRRFLRPQETWAIKHKSCLYDIIFVLPEVNSGPAPGGYRVVYEIARRLGRDGFTTGILYISTDISENFVQPFRRRLVNRYLPTFSIGPIQIYDPSTQRRQMEDSLLSAVASKENFENVHLILSSYVDVVRTRKIFATHFTTAFYVDRYRGDAEKFYLVEHSEDDPSFSGVLSGVARQSYSLPLKKVVTNKNMYRRFQADNPRFLELGFASDFYKLTNAIADRRKSVLLPLFRNESKGAVYGLEAMRLLKADMPGVEILSYGDWPETKVPPYVNFHFGPSSEKYDSGPRNEILLRLYNTASVFVLPSLVEGFSLPTLEAMHCGCAVVVTDNGGVNEYIEDGANGIVVPVCNPVALKNGVYFLLTNSQERLEMAQRGRKTASKFSLEKCYSSFLSII